MNPFRYRGYYYDTEIEMYYLQSRYYDPVVGRFINGDDVNIVILTGGILDTNIFAYCANNCVNQIDISGNIYIPWKLIIVVTAGIVVGIAKISSTINSKSYKNARGSGKFLQVVTAFVLGFVQGAITALLAIVNKTALLGVVGGLINIAKTLKSNKKATPIADLLVSYFVEEIFD